MACGKMGKRRYPIVNHSIGKPCEKDDSGPNKWIWLPDDARPRHYKEGVFVIGSMFWPLPEVRELPASIRMRLLSLPYMLLRGGKYRTMEIIRVQNIDVQSHVSLKKFMRRVERALAA